MFFIDCNMYHFNFLLFKNLSSVLGMTQRQLSMKVFGKENRYWQKTDNQSIILVSDMISVCNTLHISLSHFISLEPNQSYRDKSTEYVIDNKLFKPIFFDSKSLTKMYGKDGLVGPITKEEFAKGIGITAPSLYLWINKDQCAMRMSQLIGMCNKYGVNIGTFISDENIPLPLNDVVVDLGRKSSEKKFEELIEMREIVSHQQRELAKLKRENKSLELNFKGNRVAEEQQIYKSGGISVRKWSFRKDLLDNLNNLFQISQADLWKGMGMTNPTMSYNEGNITVQLLVDICNKYEISTKHFFIRESEQRDIIRELSFYKSENFKHIQFHPEYIRDIFGKNSLTDMSLIEVLDLLGYSEMKIRMWKNTERSTLRVDDLVDLCNALNVTPSCFITDSNRTMAVYRTTQAEFFLEENRMLRQENIRLREKIKKIMTKETN